MGAVMHDGSTSEAGRTADGTSIPGQVRPVQQVVRFRVEPQQTDARAAQFQCVVTLENGGPERVQISQLRSLQPPGVSLPQFLDGSREREREDLKNLYLTMATQLGAFLLKDSPQYRGAITEAAGDVLRRALNGGGMLRMSYLLLLGKFNKPMTSTFGAFFERQLAKGGIWDFKISNSEHADELYKLHLEPKKKEHEGLCNLFRSSINHAKRLEQELDGGQVANVIADVAPGDVFSRTYVFNCTRRFLSARNFTISFECLYRVGAQPSNGQNAALMRASRSITTTILPKPFVLSIVAMCSAILGTILNLTLTKGQAEHVFNIFDLTNAAGWATPIGDRTVGTQICAAIITALFFFNIYDSTEMGKKIDVGAGWRSALLIGGLSGLLNDKVVAALRALMG
jgi:hypothetical protein